MLVNAVKSLFEENPLGCLSARDTDERRTCTHDLDIAEGDGSRVAKCIHRARHSPPGKEAPHL